MYDVSYREGCVCVCTMGHALSVRELLPEVEARRIAVAQQKGIAATVAGHVVVKRGSQLTFWTWRSTKLAYRFLLRFVCCTISDPLYISCSISDIAILDWLEFDIYMIHELRRLKLLISGSRYVICRVHHAGCLRAGWLFLLQ
jgi:hypothetical protein